MEKLLRYHFGPRWQMWTYNIVASTALLFFICAYLPTWCAIGMAAVWGAAQCSAWSMVFLRREARADGILDVIDQIDPKLAKRFR